MKFTLEKTTVMELNASQMNQVAGGEEGNTYHTCAGTCGCPTTCDTSVNCTGQSAQGNCGTTMDCKCPTVACDDTKAF